MQKTLTHTRRWQNLHGANSNALWSRMESMLPAATGADMALSFKLIGHTRVAEGLELFTRSFTGSLVYLLDGGIRILLLHRSQP